MVNNALERVCLKSNVKFIRHNINEKYFTDKKHIDEQGTAILVKDFYQQTPRGENRNGISRNYSSYKSEPSREHAISSNRYYSQGRNSSNQYHLRQDRYQHSRNYENSRRNYKTYYQENQSNRHETGQYDRENNYYNNNSYYRNESGGYQHQEARRYQLQINHQYYY